MIQIKKGRFYRPHNRSTVWGCAGSSGDVVTFVIIDFGNRLSGSVVKMSREAAAECITHEVQPEWHNVDQRTGECTPWEPGEETPAVPVDKHPPPEYDAVAELPLADPAPEPGADTRRTMYVGAGEEQEPAPKRSWFDELAGG